MHPICFHSNIQASGYVLTLQQPIYFINFLVYDSTLEHTGRSAISIYSLLGQNEVMLTRIKSIQNQMS